MKDCAYKSDGNVPMPVTKEREDGLRYPSFSLYGAEPVTAVFGDSELKAGKKIRITADLLLKRVVTGEDGAEEVSVDIVAVGGKPTEVQGEEDDSEEEDD